MAMPLPCTRELLPAGGPGTFLLGRTQTLMEGLLAEYAGKAQLLYLDPPFGTGDIFRMQIGAAAIARPAYSDTLKGDAYLAWMRGILAGCRELLCAEGSLYLHVDYRMAAPLKLLLDELFGAENFMNEIVWMYKSGGRSTRHFSRKHDTILFYRKSKAVYFNIDAAGSPRGPERRNHMRRSVDEEGRVTYSIRTGGKVYAYHEQTPVYPSDVWTDIEHLHQRDPERLGYATQKPEALLRRIIGVSSRPGDLVADLFSGSGTTAAAASAMGRPFLATDSSPFALYALRRRQSLRHNPMNFLEQGTPLTLHFPAGLCGARLDAALQTAQNVCTCEVQKYTADSGAPLIYAALGAMEGDTFRPAAFTYHPETSAALRMPAVPGRAALMTMDAEGLQMCWAVE